MNTNNPNYKHGMSDTPIYFAWKSMNKRVNNKSQISYKNYGKRGITICEEWKKDFISFFNDMGSTFKKGLTLDRIDNNKGYCKENCRWATRLEQSRNRRNVRMFSYKGDTLFISDFAKKYKIHYAALKARIEHGKTIKEAIETGNTDPLYYFFDKKVNKYKVCVTKNGNRIYGGVFNTTKEAEKKVAEIIKIL